MHLKDLLGSIARAGYCIPAPDFYLVLHDLRCWKSTIIRLATNLVNKKIRGKYFCCQGQVRLDGWLWLTSHRQRGHLETAPTFTVPCKGCEARFLHRSHQESNARLSRGSSLYYCCATPAQGKWNCLSKYLGKCLYCSFYFHILSKDKSYQCYLLLYCW